MPIASSGDDARLTVGPVLFNWPTDRWRDFHYRIADEAPVDTVHVGEVVCAKRLPFRTDAMADVIERLEAGGKQVILSTLALIMDERDMDAVRAIAAPGERMIEANDAGTCSLLVGRPHTVGPYVNVFNPGTADVLARNGAVRITVPVELPLAAIGVLAACGDAEIEVQVFGRLPLAISARCYHARAHGLSRDGCRYVCGDDPDGMPVETSDNMPFLAVNGMQTMSHTYGCLMDHLDVLRDAGVRWFRLSPQDTDMVAVARTFRDVLDARIGADEGLARLGALCPDASFSNGFLLGKAGRHFLSRSNEAE